MRYVPLLSTLLLLTTPHLGSSQTVYDVVPVDLGGGYQIAGGTITVLGTEITAWNIPVTGVAPHTFSEANPGALLRVTGDGFNITPEQISFSATQLGHNRVAFFASENTFVDCVNLGCTQQLDWVSQGPPAAAPFSRVGYFFFGVDGDPAVLLELPLGVGELVVATVVPEPTSSLLLVLGVLGLMGARQKRRRR